MFVSRVLAVLLLTGAVTACGGPETSPKIPPAEPTAAPVPSVEAQPQPTAAVSLGPAPADLRSVDWPNSPLPGEFCGIAEVVPFRGGEAMATSTQWGQVHLFSALKPEDVTYGDLDGDGRNEAAVPIGCDNNGGTAGGQLAFGFVVVGAAQATLRAVGSIVAKQEPSDAGHVTLLDEAKITKGEVRVTERWYRPSDANCCPSGVAHTTWSYRDGTLVAGTPVIVS